MEQLRVAHESARRVVRVGGKGGERTVRIAATATAAVAAAVEYVGHGEGVIEVVEELTGGRVLDRLVHQRRVLVRHLAHRLDEGRCTRLLLLLLLHGDSRRWRRRRSTGCGVGVRASKELEGAAAACLLFGGEFRQVGLLVPDVLIVTRTRSRTRRHGHGGGVRIEADARHDRARLVQRAERRAEQRALAAIAVGCRL